MKTSIYLLALLVPLAIGSIGCASLLGLKRQKSAVERELENPEPEQRPSKRASSKDASASREAKPEASKPPVPTTITFRSECSKTVPVFFGEGKPGFSSGRKSRMSGNTISSEGRTFDGTLTVWLLDDHDNGTTKIKAEPTDKAIIIDRSCTSLRVE